VIGERPGHRHVLAHEVLHRGEVAGVAGLMLAQEAVERTVVELRV
jgi:hypothetical protein